MSYDDPEEELLDQHLREAFSEFELPPANQVWKGIEGRIGTLPGAVQPLVPLKFFLPAAVLAGVAAGWLLPRPGTTVPAARAPMAYVAPVSATSSASAPVAAAPVVSRVAAGSGPQFAAISTQPAKQPVAVVPVAPLAPQSPVLTAAPVSAPATLLVPYTDSSTAASSPLYASAVPAESGADSGPAANTTESPKTDGAQGFHAEFRQPTHRRAEKGRGIRRRLSAVGQWARHLLSPHQARTTGQPSF